VPTETKITHHLCSIDLWNESKWNEM